MLVGRGLVFTVALTSEPVFSPFCCRLSIVSMITVEATAATKISAINTIMAPIPMEPSLDFMHELEVTILCISYVRMPRV